MMFEMEPYLKVEYLLYQVFRPILYQKHLMDLLGLNQHHQVIILLYFVVFLQFTERYLEALPTVTDLMDLIDFLHLSILL